MVKPLTDGQSPNGAFHPNAVQERLAFLLTGNSGHKVYSTQGNGGILDGAPSLSVASYGPDGNYDVPLSIVGIKEIGTSAPRQELSDWLGEGANSVPDGTLVVSVVGYLGAERFFPVITFPHSAYHIIGVMSDGKNIGSQASLEKQVRVKNRNGAGNPDGSWNSNYFPPLQDIESGHRSSLALVAGPFLDIG